MTPTLLFVHSPVVGPSTWMRTADVLRDKGFHCEVPNLTRAVAAPCYPRLARTAAESVSGPVALIGHSNAGSLLPTIAEILGEQARAAVFVDALLPHPGRSWFDTAPRALREQLRSLAVGGQLPPWHEWFAPSVIEELVPEPQLRQQFVAEIPRLPLAYFEESAPATRGDAVPCAYLRFSAAYDHAADEAQQRGWVVVREDWDHLRMLSDPAAVADLVSQTIDVLAPG